MKSKEEITALVHELAKQVLQANVTPKGKIDFPPTASSFEMVAWTVALESAFGVRFTIEEILAPSFGDVDLLVSLIQSKLSAALH